MLIRMIASMPRWDGSKPTKWGTDKITGDAISDLRTTNNELSVWIGNTPEEREDAIVALALNRDKVSKLLYVELDETDLEGIEIVISDEKEGSSPGLDPSIIKQHRDLKDLDYGHIGYLAEYITDLIRNKGKFAIISKSEVEKLLTKYKDQNKIDLSKMNETLKEYLNW